MNAVMDVCDHKFYNSVFYKPGCTKKIFGTEWNLWFGSDRMWLNKYVNRDPDQGLRTWRILFWDMHFVQLSDVWHFAKMLMIGMLLIHLPVGIFIGYNTTLPIWLLASAAWVINSFAWNFSFNLFYKKILIKK